MIEFMKMILQIRDTEDLRADSIGPSIVAQSSYSVYRKSNIRD